MDETQNQQGEKQLSHIRCPGCGEFLPAGTARLRFHDSRCRASFWRRKHLVKFHSELIQSYITGWMSVLEIEPNDAIQKALDEILLTIGVDNVRMWERTPGETEFRP